MTVLIVYELLNAGKLFVFLELSEPNRCLV